MTNGDDEEAAGSYASPPCFMHELDPAYLGLTDAPDPQQRADVLRWRKAERERLIKERLAIESAARRRMAEEISARLSETIGDPAGLTVSAYWPFRGEPDLRGLMEQIVSKGGKCALPIVVERGRPLIFRSWAPGDPLERGVWNIPIPAGGEEVVPDVVIAPVVGFDRAGFRLGYGGGFYDRTLAALPKRPRVFGVGYGQAALATIYPLPHDIPMDVIITEQGISTLETTGRDSS